MIMVVRGSLLKVRLLKGKIVFISKYYDFLLVNVSQKLITLFCCIAVLLQNRCKLNLMIQMSVRNHWPMKATSMRMPDQSMSEEHVTLPSTSVLFLYSVG